MVGAFIDGVVTELVMVGACIDVDVTELVMVGACIDGDVTFLKINLRQLGHQNKYLTMDCSLSTTDLNWY